MPKIVFLPSTAAIDVPSGTGLLDAARQAGVEMETACGAEGSCGDCIVRITDGEADSDSLGMLSESAVVNGYVLACQTRILDTPQSSKYLPTAFLRQTQASATFTSCGSTCAAMVAKAILGGSHCLLGTHGDVAGLCTKSALNSKRSSHLCF